MKTIFQPIFIEIAPWDWLDHTMAPTTCWNLRVSAEANQGGRKYMEDVTAVHFERANGVEFASFAIFDGHGGREASHFAKVRNHPLS